MGMGMGRAECHLKPVNLSLSRDFLKKDQTV